MTRRLKTDIPGPDRRVSAEEVREKGWRALFAPELQAPLPLVVDLGFGRGEFLMQLAAEAPDVAHLGVEISAKRVLKMARRLAKSELGNVRIVEATAESAVRDLLDQASVRRFWINFPDPWPKKRHHKRRLINPEFVQSLHRALRPGGILHLATDWPPYAAWMLEVLERHGGFTNLAGRGRLARRPDWRPQTKFERRGRGLGHPVSDLVFQKPEADAADRPLDRQA